MFFLSAYETFLQPDTPHPRLMVRGSLLSMLLRPYTPLFAPVFAHSRVTALAYRYTSPGCSRHSRVGAILEDLTPPPGRPHFSKSGPPVERDARRPFLCGAPTSGAHVSTLDGARGQVAGFSRLAAHLGPGTLEQI